MAKVSIIVPCYNVERFLDRCIKTLISQTLTDLEIILVDDGSPDNVGSMCDKYAKIDSRIVVIHKRNGGLGFARNSGLEVATGDYIAFVDSDDYVDINMYATLFTTAEKENADAVFCGFCLETREGQWERSAEVNKITVWEDRKVSDFMLDMVANAPVFTKERNYYMSVWHAIYRREIIEKHKVRFVSEREYASEDIPFQVDFLMHSKRVVYLPENFYYYCLNGASLTSTFKAEKYERFRRLRNLLLLKLEGVENSTERCNRFFIGYTRTQLHHLMLSEESNKYERIKEIVHDPIWNELKYSYPARNFKRLDIELIYQMILGKRIFMLWSLSKLTNFAKIVLHRR